MVYEVEGSPPTDLCCCKYAAPHQNNTMKTTLHIVLAGLASAVAGFRSAQVWGIGEYPSGTNETVLRDAIQSSNASRSVPFQLGAQTFQLRASVASVQNPSDDPSDENLAAIFTQYTLSWEGGSDLNATVAAAENLTDSQQPRLCATHPSGLYSASVTNGYDFDEPGSCAGALGSKCFDAMTSWGFAGYLPNCAATFNVPEECDGIFSGGFNFGRKCCHPALSPPDFLSDHMVHAQRSSPTRPRVRHRRSRTTAKASSPAHPKLPRRFRRRRTGCTCSSLPINTLNIPCACAFETSMCRRAIRLPPVHSVRWGGCPGNSV